MGSQYRLYRRKSGFYYHRVKVPADIRQLYGKQIEQQSLETRDFREAVRRLPAVIVRMDRVFSRFREANAEAIGTLQMEAASHAVARIDVRRLALEYGKRAEAEEFARRALAFKAASENFRAYRASLSLPECYDDFLDHWDGQGDVAPVLGLVHRLYIEERLSAFRKARATGNFERWELVADDVAPKADLVQRVALIKALMDAEMKVLEDWHEQPDFVEHPQMQATAYDVAKPSVPETPLVSVQHVEPARPALPTMSKLYRECFAAIGKEKRWSAKTDLARHSQIKLFLEICGDKPLNEYTQADIRRFKQVLIDLPANSHSKGDFKKLSKVEAANKAKKMGVSGLSVESIRQNMTAVSMVYGWTRANYDLALQNYIVPLIPPPQSAGDRRDRRQTLDISDLKRLFRQPVFTGVKSDVDWYQPGSVDMRRTGRFWVPLLALFSGARLMEAVQLLRQDVGCENGIWFIDINDDDDEESGKTVKNHSSIRRIPLHPELQRLGFVKFVETASTGERLFPDIEIGPPAQRARHASKMFNKLLHVAGVKSEKKVWHSLRHSFEQVCRDSRVDSAIMDQLQGHTQHGMRKTYGDGYGLEALQDGINSIRYEGLDLSHIEPFG